MTLLINLASVFFVLVALLMVLVILMQRPKSEGLGAAFGGAVTENIFGAQTTNVLVKFTTWLAGIFFALTFGLSVLYAHRGTGGESAFRRELMKQQAAPATAPATSPAPATAQPSPVSSPASSPVQTSPASSPAPAAQPTATP
jgi:preprotein translocase subunit SecG